MSKSAANEVLSRRGRWLAAGCGVGVVLVVTATTAVAWASTEGVSRTIQPAGAVNDKITVFPVNGATNQAPATDQSLAASAVTSPATSDAPAVTQSATPTDSALASATSNAATPSGSPAVISPIIHIFQFGATVGVPLGCETAQGAINQFISTYPQLSSTLGLILNDIATECVSFATEGASALGEFDDDVAALSAINPVVNPGIAALATALQTIGSELSLELGPLASLFPDLAQDALFFQGTGS